MLPLLWLAAAASAASYDLPALPVRLALSGGDGVCASQALRERLEYRFLRVVGPGVPADLEAACAQTAEGLSLTVDAPGGAVELTTKIPDGATADQVAYLAAGSLARDPDVVDAALEAYLRFNADLAAAGADDFAAKDWEKTLFHMQRALESDVNPPPIYFALYSAEAGLKHPLRAKWYLAAFLLASKKKASQLTDKQAWPLAGAQAQTKARDDAAAADDEFARYQELAKAHRWHDALNALRDIVGKAPWYEPAYRSLAQSYRAIGWKRLAKLWKARADFAAKVDKDKALGKAIEARLDALR